MNLNFRIFLVCALSLIAHVVTVCAQTSHDLALFEAKGPVKSITLTAVRDNYILSPVEGITYFNSESTTFNFDRQGNLEFWLKPEHDSKGYIISLDYGTAHADYAYSNGNVSEMKFKLKNSSGEASFTYSSKGNLTTATEMIMGNQIITLEGKYSNYQYDSHGNWIKRSLTISPLMANGEGPSNTVVQTRTISYY